MNIATRLSEQAHRYPGHKAIIDGKAGQERITTYAQLENQSAQFAASLQAYGLQRGDVVLIFLPVSLELYVTLMGLFRLGLTAMFVDPASGRQHIRQCCQRVTPKALIASSKAHYLRLIVPALRRIPLKIALGHWLPFTKSFAIFRRYSALADIVTVQQQTPALITFTSGSTGLPKAAVRSHGFLLAQHRVLADSIRLQPGQIDISTLPVFVLANLASGLCSILCDVDLRSPAKIAAKVVIQQMHRFAATRCAASPAFFARLADYCEQSGQTLAQLQRIDTGGAPVFPSLMERLSRLAPATDIVAVYGSTEAEPIAHIHWRQVSAQDKHQMQSGKGLLAGQPVAQIQLRILRDQTGSALGKMSADEFEEQCLAANTVGEIVVAGEHVLPGYLQGIGDEQTKFSVVNQPWHRTGDAGYLDEQGRLWLLGRCGARISDERGELFPFAVETVLMSLPMVERCALVSYQQQRVLLVQAKKALEIAELQPLLQWAQLDQVIKVADIPVDKRHNAKIDYPKVQQLLADKC